MIGAINWASWLVWGFAATVVLTTMLAGSVGLGLTRMSIPFLLGTIFTPDRDRARLIGIAVHLANGFAFSIIYVLAFHVWGGPAWWKGGAIGAVHAAFVLIAFIPALPGMHPRMASETTGPTTTRLLEPPGFMALHYGRQTPLMTLLAHLAFGVILGALYRPA
jgi:uncharacterized membrane protein YagU involved in acid resistance